MPARDLAFTHLHVHSDYSLLDGTCRLKDLTAKAAHLGMPAVAITDHGVLYGLISFQQACKDAGIKPIFGCEVYLAPGSHTERAGKPGADLGHLVLLAENETGYRNLLKLVSISHLDGFYYKPRIDKELLARYHEGLIALGGCLQGEVAQLLTQGRAKEAREAAANYRDIMGAGNFFIEIMDHGIPEQKKVNPQLIRLAGDMKIPLIASNDVHYLNREDAEAHDILLCIQTNSVRDDPKRMRFHGDQFYFKTPEEMAALFPDLTQAMTNTVEIAERCNVTIPTGGMILPEFPVPIAGMSKIDYLRKLCIEKLPERFPKQAPEVTERLEKELDVVSRRGIEAFILIAWDIMDFAHKNDILVGPGRGSAAGVLMLYILGVTELNPMHFGLPFERWINLERLSMPDIDCDFEPSRRGEVIQYIAGKYGSDHVAQIITFGTIGARQAIRDAGRVLRIPIPELDRISKRIAFNQSLSEFLAADGEIRKEQEANPTLRHLFDTARTIEGLARHASTHAGGVVISPQPLTELVPLQRPTGGVEAKHQKQGNGEEKAALQAMTQFDMDGIAAVGLAKMDVLGLRTLGVIRDTLKMIEQARGKKLDMASLPLDDRATYELLSRGDTNAVFQLESAGMKQVLHDLRPDRFDDIVAVVALYRPGPMAQIPNYISGKHGRRKVTYLRPELEPILAETYGIIVYQEQVMEIARRLAGFSLGKADALLKAMSKKKRELMASLEAEFLKGAKDRGTTEKIAREIFQQMNDFAGYGFNKAHSACYALSAYQTAYLKANYPPEYLAAQLSSMMDNKEKSTALMEECRRMKIEVLPPDINDSEAGFSVQKGKVRFGLAAIKHLGNNSIEAILSARASGGPFINYSDFCRRLPAGSINRSGLEVLAKSGALAALGMNRAATVATISSGMIPGKANLVPSTQGSLFGDEAEISGEGLISDGPTGMNIPEYPLSELLKMEKELLGLYLSDHPLNAVKDMLEQCVTAGIAGLAEHIGGEVVIGGILTSLRRHTDRSGRAMAFITVEDFTAVAETTIFSEPYERCRSAIEQGAIVLAKGRVEAPQNYTEGEEAVPKMIVNDIVLLTDIKGRDRMRRAKNGAPRQQRLNNFGGPAAKPAAPVARPAAPVSPEPKGTVHIRCLSSSQESLEQIRQLIKQNPGPTPVFLHIKNGEGEQVLNLGQGFTVRVTKLLLERFEELLGREMAWLEE